MAPSGGLGLAGNPMVPEGKQWHEHGVLVNGLAEWTFDSKDYDFELEKPCSTWAPGGKCQRYKWFLDGASEGGLAPVPLPQPSRPSASRHPSPSVPLTTGAAGT